MGLIVDKKKQNVLPELDAQLQTSSVECSNTGQLPFMGNIRDLHQHGMLGQIEDNPKQSDNNGSTQMVKNFGKT